VKEILQDKESERVQKANFIISVSLELQTIQKKLSNFKRVGLLNETDVSDIMQYVEKKIKYPSWYKRG